MLTTSPPGPGTNENRETHRVRDAARQGRDVGVAERGDGAERAGIGHVVEEDVDAVGLVLEAQVAHPRAIRRQG